jgi:hypothetical protein
MVTKVTNTSRGIQWWPMFDWVLANANQALANGNQALANINQALANGNQVLANGNQVLANGDRNMAPITSKVNSGYFVV